MAEQKIATVMACALEFEKDHDLLCIGASESGSLHIVYKGVAYVMTGGFEGNNIRKPGVYQAFAFGQGTNIITPGVYEEICEIWTRQAEKYINRVLQHGRSENLHQIFRDAVVESSRQVTLVR